MSKDKDTSYYNLFHVDGVIIYRAENDIVIRYKGVDVTEEFVDVPISSETSVALHNMNEIARMNRQDRHEAHFLIRGWDMVVEIRYDQFTISARNHQSELLHKKISSDDILPQRIVKDPTKLEEEIRDYIKLIDARVEALSSNKQLVKDIQQKFYDEEDKEIADQKG